MREVNIKQGSHEWLLWRTNFITATDYCAAIAEKPLFSGVDRKSVIRKKLYPESKPRSSKWMELGKRLEESEHKHAMRTFGLLQERKIKRELLVEADNGICAASLDACSHDFKLVIEYKTTSKPSDMHDTLVDYYKAQVHHQMFCTNADLGLLIITYLKDEQPIERKHVLIGRNQLPPKERWQQFCFELWNEVQQQVNLGEKLEDIDCELLKLYQEKEHITERIEELKQLMIEQQLHHLEHFQLSSYESNKIDYRGVFNKISNLEIVPDYKASVTEYLNRTGQHASILSDYIIDNKTVYTLRRK